MQTAISIYSEVLNLLIYFLKSSDYKVLELYFYKPCSKTQEGKYFGRISRYKDIKIIGRYSRNPQVYARGGMRRNFCFGGILPPTKQMREAQSSNWGASLY
jgi:hypothetical protein